MPNQFAVPSFIRQFLFTALLCVLMPACGGKTGGPVTGAPDSHCAGKVVTVDPGACHPDAGTAASDDADAGADDGNDFGPPQYNTEADDDDCKYHVRYSMTPTRQGDDITFTVVATYKSNGTPVTGADIYPDVTLTSTHPGDTRRSKSKEAPAGTYTVGPVRFDASGTWTVRFHFFGDCVDSEDSPHGHVAFFVDVP